MRRIKLLSVQHKGIRIITLLALVGAGFSSLDSFPRLEIGKKVFAAEETRKTVKVSRKKKKAEASEKTSKGQTGEGESLFLSDSEKTIDYMPEIFRCSECGYEQEEPGTCPDHNTLELIKVLSRGRDPLEPSELDGNEDIIVDIPLKNLQFKKEAVLPTATATATPE